MPFLCCRTLSPQTTSSNSEGSMPESQKTPLIIINLNIAPETKTLAPKDLKRDPKKLPPFCVQYQNTVSKNYSASDNAKSANDFVVQGRLISSKRTCKNHPNGRNIVINCEEEYETCTDICTEFGESEIAGNVFNNINTDLLLTLDCYEMDNFGRLQNSRTPSPNYTQVSPLSMRSNTPTLLIPPGYRPLCIRTPSPSTRQIIRVDLTNRDISSAKSDDKMKQLNYNMNRLKEKRGRNKKPI